MSDSFVYVPAPDESVHLPREHADSCEAEPGHASDCQTATELARLRAFAEAVRDEMECSDPDLDDNGKYSDAHIADCFHCAAEQALERAR